MKIKWWNEQSDFDELILAGDIGGTNTNLAMVARKGTQYSLLVECIFASDQIDGLQSPIEQTLAVAAQKNPSLVPSRACISAAGPVADNVCVLTNCHWNIIGHQLSQALKFPVLVINDFLAISYGTLILDVQDKNQIYPLHHLDGSYPQPQAAATKAVIGPGTGMGVSFLAWDGQKHIPCSSEGGHITFAPFDEETRAVAAFMEKRLGTVSGIEPLVSGTGIRNLYHFYEETGRLPENETWQRIAATPDADRPKQISMASDHDPVAADLMRLFVRMLGRFSSDISALFLPLGGLYLAGGVVQKDLRWLEKDNLFMQYFERNYNPNIRPILTQIPVYLIKDYSISLLGAAHAATQLKDAE